MSATYEGQDTGRGTTDGGGSMRGSVREAAGEVRQQASAEGRRLRDEAMEGVRRQADQQKRAAGTYLHTVASAIGSGAEAFRRDGMTGAGSMLESAAGEIDRFADQIADRPPEDILRDVESFARRHPAVFFGSAFLLAFGATRLLKSSAPSGGMHRDDMYRHSASAQAASPGIADRDKASTTSGPTSSAAAGAMTSPTKPEGVI